MADHLTHAGRRGLTADRFRNAIGVLQWCGPPASFGSIQTTTDRDQPANPMEVNAQLFAVLTAPKQDTDVLMDSLPSEESPAALRLVKL
uniref:Uncharacterized protein n=1 Tax=Catagonus wagneri TaxID=51154 RepID=A0A8C3VCZ1_9CETA